MRSDEFWASTRVLGRDWFDLVRIVGARPIRYNSKMPRKHTLTRSRHTVAEVSEPVCVAPAHHPKVPVRTGSESVGTEVAATLRPPSTQPFRDVID